MRGSDNNDIISSRKLIFNNNNLANSKLKSATSSTVRHTALIRSKAVSAESGNIRTTTINQFDNLTSPNNDISKKLLLKKQLRLNLNETIKDVPKRNKKDFKEILHPDYEKRIDSSTAKVHNVDFSNHTNYDDYDYDDDNVKYEDERRNRSKLLQQSSPHSLTSTSLLKSSPTALAKFNRIIDATVPTSNVYQQTSRLQQQHQQQHAEQPNQNTTSMALETRLALAYRKIVSEDSLRMRITANSTTESIKLNINNNNNKQNGNMVAKDVEHFSKKNVDDNQIKRNDVHYLLKQLNSFSDIEKIEIVDMKQEELQSEQQLEPQQQRQEQKVYESEENSDENIEKYSPTTRSLVLISPSSLSHKGIRRYASLHQTQEKLPVMVPTSMSQQQIPHDVAAIQYYNNAMNQQEQAVGWQQFDDYIFQSCHYLETNHIAANYRTTMIESNSHEFRPSTKALTSASYSSHSSVHAFDLYESQPPSVVCNTIPLPVVEQQQKSQYSIISQAQYHHPYATIHAQQPPVLGPPARRFQLQTRLTSSGVQTELTPSSLSSAATNPSLAKSYSSHSSNSSNKSCCNRSSCKSRSSHATSVNSSEVVFCRLMPIFKCCYMPIDRWCERRNAASQAALEKQRTTTTMAMELNDLTKKKE